MPGVKRSVERDYLYYDPPEIIWEKINGKAWEYKTREDYFQVRDLALMSSMYLSCARVSEIVRATLQNNIKKKSVTADQFVIGNDFLSLRNLPIIKVKTVKRGNKWIEVKRFEDYPVRREIKMPRTGGLSKFTDAVIDHLKQSKPNEELFKIHRHRAWGITNHITGEMNHYLRDMGLKLYVRLFNRNIASLKRFSGHRRVENLIRYLGEGEIDDTLLSYKEF